MLFYVATILIIGIIMYITMPSFNKMMVNGDCVEYNYKHEKIPVGLGIFITLYQVFSIMFISILLKQEIYTLYIILILLVSLVGFVDDTIGDKNIKGFKGHIKALLKGNLTTGGLKALVGFIASIYFSVIVSNNVFEFIINTLLIALFTNLLNLFDLRPGRAIKVFIFLSIILIVAAVYKPYNYILFSLIAIVLGYLPFDIKGRTMMGDAGSNMLGISLGIYCALTQTLMAKITWLTILILLNIISEKYSFTKIINSNRILNYLDNVGK